jgi:hypothetical protein
MLIEYPKPKAPELDTVLWRYMPGEYFLKMLEPFQDQHLWLQPKGDRTDYCPEPGQLWFSYPSAFEDHFEGQFPDWNRDPEKYWEHLAKEDSLTPEEVARRRSMVKLNEAETVRTNILSAAELTGVSCWTTKPAHGEGLWEIVEGGNCVAIRSTCGGILDSLAHAHCSPVKLAKPAASHVAYINHAEYFIKHDGCRILLALMRTKHTDEAEVRFFANSPLLASLPTELKFPGLLSGEDAPPSKEVIFTKRIQHQMSLAAEYERLLAAKAANEGFYLPIKLDLILHEIVFGHGCSDVFKDSVNATLSRIGLGEVSRRAR